MNKIKTKVMSAVLAVVMVFSIITVTDVKAAEQADKKTTVTFSAEKFTIGQGYLVEPVQVEVKDGDTVATVFEEVMKAEGITYPSTSSDYGFYLTSIDNADSGVVSIPKEISLMPDVSLWDGSIVKAPAKEVNDGNVLPNKGLGTGSYNQMSGWMFMINNKDSGVSADQIKVKDGDVIRLQFSVYGYGADIGFDTESYTGIVSPVLANKDVLMKEVAAVRTDVEMIKNDMVKTAYDNAMTVLGEYNISQKIADSALAVLQQAEKSFEESKPEEKEEPVKITVKRAVVSKAANIKKYRAKVRVKKMSGVSGYQFRYANNRKLKKYKTKTTRRTTITTKKFKKNQTCYVKIRAYVNADGKRIYGRWSKVKSVKITK